MENVRFGRLGALPRTLATYAPSRPVFLEPPGLVPGGQNEGWQPTGPTYWTEAPGTEGAGAEAPKAPELRDLRIQQKLTNTAEARDSEQKPQQRAEAPKYCTAEAPAASRGSEIQSQSLTVVVSIKKPRMIIPPIPPIIIPALKAC